MHYEPRPSTNHPSHRPAFIVGLHRAVAPPRRSAPPRRQAARSKAGSGLGAFDPSSWLDSTAAGGWNLYDTYVAPATRAVTDVRTSLGLAPITASSVGLAPKPTVAPPTNPAGPAVSRPIPAQVQQAYDQAIAAATGISTTTKLAMGAVAVAGIAYLALKKR